MTAALSPRFIAARIDGRYRVQDTLDGAIVATLSSKTKAEEKAAKLSADAAELLAMVEADAAMEQEMEQECPQEPEWQAELDEQAAARAEEHIGPSPEVVAEAAARLQAELTANAAAIGAILSGEDAPAPAESHQEEPPAAAGTEDTPKAEKPVEELAKVVKAKAHQHGKDQPAPHAFTTVGTTIPNHCAECGRTWAAASHRKFREAAADAAPAGEWTPAADDTTVSGEAPALDSASA